MIFTFSQGTPESIDSAYWTSEVAPVEPWCLSCLEEFHYFMLQRSCFILPEKLDGADCYKDFVPVRPANSATFVCLKTLNFFILSKSFICFSCSPPREECENDEGRRRDEWNKTETEFWCKQNADREEMVRIRDKDLQKKTWNRLMNEIKKKKKQKTKHWYIMKESKEII